MEEETIFLFLEDQLVFLTFSNDEPDPAWNI